MSQILCAWAALDAGQRQQLVDSAAMDDAPVEPLDDHDKRDVLAMLCRLGDPTEIGHMACVTMQLELDWRRVVAFMLGEVLGGPASIRRCQCGRPFPSLNPRDAKCAVCSLR